MFELAERSDPGEILSSFLQGRNGLPAAFKQTAREQGLLIP